MTMRDRKGNRTHNQRRPDRGVAVLCAALCVGSLIAGCVPEPRSFQADSLGASQRIAILPLSNYTADRDVPDRVRPMLAAGIGRLPGVWLIDSGAVEEALSLEPWLIFDRIPPDLVDRLGEQLDADALLVGAILDSGYRQSGPDKIPHFSISLRLVRTPGARVLWSVTHSRDGADGEWLFGFGRVHNLAQLVQMTIEECLQTFPATGVVDSLSAVSASGEAR
jgi:hypothetical protein